MHLGNLESAQEVLLEAYALFSEFDRPRKLGLSALTLTSETTLLVSDVEGVSGKKRSYQYNGHRLQGLYPLLHVLLFFFFNYMF